jgi:hypothetical protein
MTTQELILYIIFGVLLGIILVLVARGTIFNIIDVFVTVQSP